MTLQEEIVEVFDIEPDMPDSESYVWHSGGVRFFAGVSYRCREGYADEPTGVVVVSSLNGHRQQATAPALRDAIDALYEQWRDVGRSADAACTSLMSVPKGR